jgi:DNA-binding NarL/FixJ family response regulator
VTRTEANARPLRILIADDDVTFRQALTAVLKRVGGVQVVATASDGLEAVRLFSELKPDLVLMDVVMPGCDGIAATKKILEVEPAARIIALTAAEDHRLLTLCMEAGAQGCLRKDPATVQLALILARQGTASRSST